MTNQKREEVQNKHGNSFVILTKEEGLYVFHCLDNYGPEWVVPKDFPRRLLMKFINGYKYIPNSHGHGGSWVRDYSDEMSEEELMLHNRLLA